MDPSNGRPTEGEKSQVTVIFGKRNSLRNPLPVNTILIVPSQDDWNDFGLRTRIDVRICLSEHSEPFATAGFIGFVTNSKDEPNGAIRLEEMLDSTLNIELPVTDSHRFFTMLPSMDAYRALVRKFGPARSVEALKAMRDLVALNEFKNSANWLDIAAQSDVFLKSFMRNAESYFAYKNAGSILRGLEHEEFGKLSEVFDIHFRLPGRQNDHELTFRFSHDNDLPKRIAVVIGKNGVGKSQALGRIVRAALSGDGSLTDGSIGGRVLVNRVLAFAPTNEAGSVFPGERRKRPKVWYRRFSLNRLGKL